MNSDQTFRFVLTTAAVILFPILLYYRIRSQATRERLDRWQEGPFILFTLRPIGLATMAGLIAYLIDPSWMDWSSLPLLVWVRWMGVGMGAIGGALIVWAFSNLAVLLAVIGNALAAANWFLLLGGISLFLLMVIRTKTEEAKLLERFGEQYRAYMARTGRFLPKLGARRLS